jgi:dihydroorotase
VDVLDYVKNVAAAEGVVRVLPFGCITKGRAGKDLTDMKWLADDGAAGFSDDGDTVMDAGLMRRAMEIAKDIGITISDHCEDAALSTGDQMNAGKLAARLSLRGVPPAAEENIIARDIELSRQTGAHIHIAHVSTAGSVELIRRAKKDGINITAEATPHHLTLTENSVIGYNTNAKVNPPLRTNKDIAALIVGLKEGVIDIIATDHAPHTAREKALGFVHAPFGISGLETALGSLMSLIHNGAIDMNLLIAKLTYCPAQIIGKRFGKLGTLETGAPADIAIFDPDKEWVVNTANFASKGRNTPLDGKTLKGKVVATLYAGNVVYKDESIKITSGNK